MNDRLARLVLALLVVTGPVVLFARLFGDAPEIPLEPGRARASVIVITAETWPDGLVDDHALDALALRAASVTQFRAPSPSAAATACSLWTGRWPTNHGVLSDRLAMTPGTWTLAEAARRSGVATYVVAQSDFPTRHGIGGFQHVAEGDFSVAQLAERAQRVIEDERGEDYLLWLHLRDAGAGGAAVGELVRACEDAATRVGDQYDTAVLVTAFQRSGDYDLHDRLVVPFQLQLPARLFGGQRGEGIAHHTDLCGLLLRLFRWQAAIPANGEMRDQSRAPMLYFALRGGNAERWYAIETPEGHLVRDISPTTKIVYECRGYGRPVMARDELELLQLDEHGAWVPVPDDLREAVYRGHYYPRVRGFDKLTTAAVPVRD